MSPPTNFYSADLARQQFQQYNETDKEKEAANNTSRSDNSVRVIRAVSQDKAYSQSNRSSQNATDASYKVKQHF
jgi:hypothetical protein